MKRAQVINKSHAGKSTYPIRPGVFLLLLFVIALGTSVFTREQNAAPAIVTITEYSDFQCPFCKRAASVVEQVRQAYGERVKVVFKQMPLPMHAHAFKAAEASVCAREQGKFWEYHDRLFASADLTVDALNRIATDVGLNESEFHQCLSSEQSRVVVEQDVAEADRLGVSGTPTFFVNDKLVERAVSFAALQLEIDGALAKGHHLPTASSSRDNSFLAATSGVGISSPVSHSKNSAATMNSATPATSIFDRQQQAVSTTTSGVTLSPAAIDFGYQLVGTTSSHIVETVTNSGSAPLVITDISVSGRDRRDFIPTYSFTLRVTIAPGLSVAINLTFTPALPWRAGTRNARLEISQKKTSQYVSLKGIGATCGGPVPACSSGCADTDSDGLNDAWEVAGGIDINNDGLVDATNDLSLPGADPHKPDIFVQYDWMDYGAPGNACSVDADCSSLGLGHKGETCSGPQVIPSATASCQYSCQADGDCTSRGPGHAQEVCRANVCMHTHDPSVTAPGALQAVIDRFAIHGINFHLIRGKALPHSTVLSFHVLSDPESPDNVMNDTCEGGSAASGTAGPGKYAESFYDLKASSSPDKLNIAYHYAIFGHYSGCDTSADCLRCIQADNPNGSPKNSPTAGESGLAEISGNDFIVSLGSHVNDLGFRDNASIEGGTFMHELGHNLGLHHGGGIDEPCQDDSQCRFNSCTQSSVGKFCFVSDDVNYKPNYLSIMNYRFQFTGIPFGSYPGDPNVVGTRLDYSGQTLPTGGNTPGTLDELNNLSEPAGLGSGTADLTSYFQYDAFNKVCIVPAVTVPTDGPIDFNGDGNTTDTNAIADLNGIDHTCGTVFARLSGATDWPEFSGFNFTYAFQCTPFGGPNGDGVSELKSMSRSGAQPGGWRLVSNPSAWNVTGGELSPEMAMNAHVLFPIRSVKTIIGPSRNNSIIAAGSPGVVQVALLGESTFDVYEVEPSSLEFGGSRALSFFVKDINGDGKPDLVATFDTSTFKLPHPRLDRLTGWLKNSQGFIGEGQIIGVP